MKHKFLKKEGNRDLILFFAGWGSAPGLFSGYRIADGHDCLMCYDYKNLAFDISLIGGGYDSVKVIAWSFGVFIANTVCRSIDGVNWADAVAFGGTLKPVDDSCGIPVAVFDGTLANMSEQVLHKFRRRMCGRCLEHFMEHCPDRALEDLKEELAALGEVSAIAGNTAELSDMTAGLTGGNDDCSTAAGFHWTRAICGRGDLIFPFANQCNAWNEVGVALVQVEAAHYDVGVFERLLGGDLFEG